MNVSNEFFLGNCLELGQTLPDKSLDLICSDPPYYVLRNANIQIKGRKSIVLNAEFDTKFKTYEEYINFMKDWLKVFVPKLKDDSRIILFFAVQYISDLIKLAKEQGLEFECVWSWHKTDPPPKFFKTSFVANIEYAVWLKKGKPPFNFGNLKDMGVCYDHPHIRKEEQIHDDIGQTVHPTQKPEDIMIHLIQIATNPYDVVCDPFAGVGSTAISCVRTTRSCISYELNPYYYKWGSQRVEKIKTILNVNARQKSILEY